MSTPCSMRSDGAQVTLRIWLIKGALRAFTCGSVLLTGLVAGCHSSQPLENPSADRFSDWNIAVSPSREFNGALTVAFDSLTLGRRVQNTVFLPTSYSGAGRARPVLYFLHGTVVAALDNDAGAVVEDADFTTSMIGRGGNAFQVELFDFSGQSAQAEYLVVAPDTDPARTICHSCLWINGRQSTDSAQETSEVLQFETFMLSELQPLIESLFNVRTDRGGRGLLGFSMGGWGALIYGTRHPDLYAFVGDVSGPAETDPQKDPTIPLITEVAIGALQSQGYGNTVTHDPVYSEMFNPVAMAANMVGANIALFLSSGNGCLSPDDLQAQDCQMAPGALTFGEVGIARNIEIAAAELQAGGLNPTHVVRPGVHGSNSHTVYARDIVPLLNAVYATPVSDPWVFNYRSGEDDFDIWDYAVQVQRQSPAFTILHDARPDASRFTVDGSNPVTVTTPSRFSKGLLYKASIQCGDGMAESRTVRSSGEGRLTLSLDLSDSESSCMVDIGESS